MTPHAVKAGRTEKRCPREGTLPIVQRGGELQTDHTAIITRLVRVLNERNYDLWETLVTEDYFEEYPQSGEVIRGPKNVRASDDFARLGIFLDRKSTRLELQSLRHIVCRLLLEKKKRRI